MIRRTEPDLGQSSRYIQSQGLTICCLGGEGLPRKFDADTYKIAKKVLVCTICRTVLLLRSSIITISTI